jgi:chemotaxis protein methyltransferase CheR
VIQWRNHQIEDVEVELLLQALRQRYGYDFTGYARASLKRRLKELQAYFDVKELSELIAPVLRDERVAQAVVNNISVPVSEFFRDPPVWRYLRDEILPRLDSFPHINIWQPGCGHGQETYTLLIVLHEAGLLGKVRLVATDINSDAMEDARRGRWNTRKFDDWEQSYRAAGGAAEFDRYFRREGDEIAIVDALRNAAEFNRHNLVADDVFMETQFVVCRNVLIYFGDALQARVVRLFARSLQRGGYLLLGRAESLPDLSGDAPLFRHMEGDNVYRRIAGDAGV